MGKKGLRERVFEAVELGKGVKDKSSCVASC